MEATTFTVPYVKPEDYDVLYGRGKSCQNHPGNLWCRQMVEANLYLYETATKREKTSLASEVLQMIRAKQGRFMKFENSCWVEVEDPVARDKISHMFRSRRRKQPDDDVDEEIPNYKSMVSDELGAPENANRRVKKKPKKNSKRMRCSES
jgi:hypothetical protein